MTTFSDLIKQDKCEVTNGKHKGRFLFMANEFEAFVTVVEDEDGMIRNEIKILGEED